MRLIDADKTIGLLKTRLYETALNNATVNCDASYLYTECADNRIEVWIDEMPTVETEPVRHAHWEQSKEDGALFCSYCGRPSYDSHDEWVEFNGMKALALVYPYYCGYCGSKMDEVTE